MVAVRSSRRAGSVARRDPHRASPEPVDPVMVGERKLPDEIGTLTGHRLNYILEENDLV